MAGRGSSRIAGLVLAGLVLAALGGMVLVSVGAHAGFGSACTQTTARFDFDAPGSSVRVSAGYQVSTQDFIGYRYKGTDANGDPLGGSGSCGSNAGGSFETLEISVGNRADRVRLDARKPRPLQADPIPGFVVVVIEGGGGPDLLHGHSGRDEVYGGGGNDVIRVAGGGADLADCGPGNDKAVVRNNDLTADCERVVER